MNSKNKNQLYSYLYVFFPVRLEIFEKGAPMALLIITDPFFLALNLSPEAHKKDIQLIGGQTSVLPFSGSRSCSRWTTETFQKTTSSL